MGESERGGGGSSASFFRSHSWGTNKIKVTYLSIKGRCSCRVSEQACHPVKAIVAHSHVVLVLAHECWMTWTIAYNGTLLVVRLIALSHNPANGQHMFQFWITLSLWPSWCHKVEGTFLPVPKGGLPDPAHTKVNAMTRFSKWYLQIWLSEVCSLMCRLSTAEDTLHTS